MRESSNPVFRSLPKTQGGYAQFGTGAAGAGAAAVHADPYVTQYPDQRQTAVALSRALRAALERAAYGVPAARWAARSVLKDEPGLELDYLALTSTDLGEAPETGEGRILVAARVGTTRLIDNLPITFDRATPGARQPDLTTAGTATAASTTSERSS